MIVLNWLKNIWGYGEPLTFVFALLSGLVYWLRVRAARRRRYSNRGGKDFVLAIQVGRSVSEAVVAHFGELDCLIDAEALLGRAELRGQEDYKKLAKELYRAMAANQHCPIKLVLSGPVGLACLVGQLAGLHKFDVEVFQFDPASKGYTALPVPGLDWL